MTTPIRILGVDPGLRNMGWGVIDAEGPRLRWVAHGVLRPPTDAPMAQRLADLFGGLQTVVADYAPAEAVVEETFVNTNPKSALTLGQARGAAMAALAHAGLPVAEFAARKIKQCVVGTGGADKSQIAFMVKRLLPKAGDMSADAADALAAAITGAHHRGPQHLELRA